MRGMYNQRHGVDGTDQATVGPPIAGDSEITSSSPFYAELKVAELPAMDLSYTPPFGAPWDALQAAADAWLAAV